MALMGSLVACHSIIYWITQMQQDEQDSAPGVIFFFVVKDSPSIVIDVQLASTWQVFTWITVFLTFGGLCISDGVGCGSGGLVGGYIMVTTSIEKAHRM